MGDQTPAAGEWVRPVILEGSLVRLEPLAASHFDDLVRIGGDTDTWRWMPDAADTAALMRIWLDAALRDGDSGEQRPFATIDATRDVVVGSTRYLGIEPGHRRVEIGATWLAPATRGLGFNDEAKLLLLDHAFEVLGCQRVEFKTDARNERSRGALLGIGARFEGVARKHMVSHGGRIRDSAWYSVIDDDWAATRDALRTRVARHVAATGAARRPR